MKNKTVIWAQVVLFLVLAAWVALPPLNMAQEAQEPTTELPITSWLLLGPFPTPLPALYKENNEGFAIEGLLKFTEINLAKLKPKSEASLMWHDGSTARWKPIEAGEKGVMLAENSKTASVAYLGTYIKVQRWTEIKIKLQSPQAYRVMLDEEIIKTKSTTAKSEEEKNSTKGRKLTADLKLETGKHLLLVKTVYDPDSHSDWRFQADLILEEKFSSPPPEISLSSDEHMTLTHLLDGPKVSDISISPCGTLAALSLRQTLPPSDSSETWIELFRISDGSLLQTFRGGTSLSQVTWAPTGKKFSYTTRDKSTGTIWVVDLKAGTTTPILENIENLGSHTWSPDSSSIIYSVMEEGGKDIPGVKRFKNLDDRQPGWRNRSYLYKVSLPDGARWRLTAGSLSTSLNGISPDGKKLLFTRSVIDYSERPYSKTELFSLDLQTQEAKILWQGKWFGSALWAPDGKRLLILGGPSAFSTIGINVPNGLVPNEYDTQAYLFDIETRKALPLTRNFNPSVNQAVWSETEDCIYFTTTDRSYSHLYRYDLKKNSFNLIDLGVEVVGQFDLARQKPVAVYTGSSSADPPKAYTIDLENKKYRTLHDPGKEDFASVRFGKVEDWSFKNKEGVTIEGRIYYPPDFNPHKKYPCIVYYYGGTSPVSREFGGRYPKNLYAAQGYIVYVLQPSGATGFGQAFSAAHVNDWGIIVADEIIAGVKKFLSAHAFVDPKKVGCMGASYGGFMTMLLLTRSNIFAAAIAHAGISSISSYWGEGYWGYAYSAIATANSFPWNRKDIYIDQSALFNADKITTPLLLLHGSVDTNVPPGESTQLFTALKILGREVEYIQIFDQDHHIMAYNKRIIWTKTIIAWFDRWLKSQPEWWYEIYPNK